MEGKKKFFLNYVVWAITKKNPFKNKSQSSLNDRIKFAKKIIGLNKFIIVKFYEKKINSNKIIDLINYIKKNHNLEIYFIIGADNLINFHKWYKWKLISKKCNIVVFDRHGYKAKSLKSITFKQLNQKNLEFVNFKSRYFIFSIKKNLIRFY